MHIIHSTCANSQSICWPSSNIANPSFFISSYAWNKQVGTCEGNWRRSPVLVNIPYSSSVSNYVVESWASKSVRASATIYSSTMSSSNILKLRTSIMQNCILEVIDPAIYSNRVSFIFITGWNYWEVISIILNEEHSSSIPVIQKDLMKIICNIEWCSFSIKFRIRNLEIHVLSYRIHARTIILSIEDLIFVTIYSNSVYIIDIENSSSIKRFAIVRLNISLHEQIQISAIDIEHSSKTLPCFHISENISTHKCYRWTCSNCGSDMLTVN